MTNQLCITFTPGLSLNENALLSCIEQGISVYRAAKITGIAERTLRRIKRRLLEAGHLVELAGEAISTRQYSAENEPQSFDNLEQLKPQPTGNSGQFDTPQQPVTPDAVSRDIDGFTPPSTPPTILYLNTTTKTKVPNSSGRGYGGNQKQPANNTAAPAVAPPPAPPKPKPEPKPLKRRKPKPEASREELLERDGFKTCYTAALDTYKAKDAVCGAMFTKRNFPLQMYRHALKQITLWCLNYAPDKQPQQALQQLTLDIIAANVQPGMDTAKHQMTIGYVWKGIAESCLKELQPRKTA